MNASQAVRYFLANDKIVKCATPEQKSRLIANVSLEKYDFDTEIYSAQSETESVYYVIDGVVSLFLECGGDPKVAQKGDYFGHEAAIDASHYASKAVVKEPATVLRFPKKAIEEIFLNNVESEKHFIFNLFRSLSGVSLSLPERPKKDEKKGPLSSGLAGWFYAILLPLIVYFLFENLIPDHSARVFVALLSIALCMWVFELVSSYIPGIFLVVSVLALGIAPTDIILSGFSSETFIMALSVYGLGSVIVSSGIIYRILLNILKYMPNSPFWANACSFFVGLVLTPAVPSASSRGVIMGPMVSDMVSYTGIKPGGGSATKLAISAYTGTNVFSAVFLSSSLHNFILLGLFWAQDQERFQWMGWLQAALLPAAIMIVAYAFGVFVFARSDEVLHINRQRIQEQYDLLGKYASRESLALICFFIFTFGVVTSNLHRLSPPTLGLIVLFILLAFDVLNRDGFQKNIDWPSLVLLGGLIGVVKVVEHLGLNAFFLEQVSWLGWYIKNDFRLFILMLTGFLFVLRLFVPYGPAVIIVATLLIPLAQQYEVNAWVVSFCTLFLGKMWFFPSQYAPYSDFKSAVFPQELFLHRHFYLFNLYMNVIRVIAVLVSVDYWKNVGLI